MSKSTASVSEQVELNNHADRLLSLCKTVISEYNNSKSCLDSLDKMRSRNRSSKVIKPQLKGLYSQAISEAEQQKRTSVQNTFDRAKNQSPPALCGSIQPSSDFVSEPGDHVAALVPEPDVAAAAFNLSEGCILAEIVSYDYNKEVYHVEDVDAEEGKVQYTLSKEKVIPLPKWKANPVTHPEAIFPKGAVVLALYPQTTCFYKAIVDESPVHIHDEYSLYFEDSSYPEGYAPAIRIPQRYVIHCSEKQTVTGKTVTNEKKRKLN